jgi:cupin 2 domain-containing protein
MNAHGNLFADLPTDISNEVVTRLVEAENIRIERIVSLGHASPDGFWYDQDQTEWVLLLRGAALLQFDDEVQPVPLKPGGFVDIAAHRRHRVIWTTPDEPTIWLAVHYD